MGLENVDHDHARLLFTQISADGATIRYEEFIKSFEPDAYKRVRVQ